MLATVHDVFTCVSCSGQVGPWAAASWEPCLWHTNLCLGGVGSELNHHAETHLRLQRLKVSCELCYTRLSHPMHLVTRHLPHYFYYQPHGFKCHHSGRHCIPNWRADQASQFLQQRSLHSQTSSVDIDSSGLYLSRETDLFRSCPTTVRLFQACVGQQLKLAHETIASIDTPASQVAVKANKVDANALESPTTGTTAVSFISNCS